jgi:hypothetical protein
MAASAPDPSAKKVAFVLSLPLDTRPTDVVTKATEAGISVSASYVSRIQSRARTKAEGAKSPTGTISARSPSATKKAHAKRPAKKNVPTSTPKRAAKPTPKKTAAAPTPKKRPAKRTPTTTPKAPLRKTTLAEDLLRAVAAEIGIGRAIQILEAEHRRVVAILRG